MPDKETVKTTTENKETEKTEKTTVKKPNTTAEIAKQTAKEIFDGMTQADQEKNKKKASEHPEMTVDGVYIEDDTLREQLKAAKEKQTAEDTKAATAEAKAKAEKLASAMKTINEALYGTDNTEVINQLQGTVGGAELSSVLGNATSVRARQHLLNFKNFSEDFKEPNSGKMPQNEDPFPVDLKIEELETHQPRVKVHELICHIHAQEVGVMALEQFHATEQRIVRLENNMATLMRYLYRLGSRVFINCQYYGGQTVFEKYKCIRCMKDDRCGDGQLMQLDQCLCCTRYEPIFGKRFGRLKAISQ